MSSNSRKFAVSAAAAGFFASQLLMFAAVAQAQQPDPKHRPQGTARGAQSAKPAPQARQPQVQRQPQASVQRQPQFAKPVPRQFVPPQGQRYAVPAPRHEERRRGYGWRPWGYGAAAAGAIIVGSRLVRSRPSDAEACANDFDSFDWDSGTIVNDDGDRQLCPYLE